MTLCRIDGGRPLPVTDPHALDFQLLFEQSPDILLVLAPDAPRFTMVAATRARFAATHTTAAETLGRGLFELFPDNPDDPAATGVANLRASLARVLATREPDTMAVQKYDIRGPDGAFQARYWSPKNIPVLAPDGAIRYILHRVEDVTELVRSVEAGDVLRDRTQAMERDVLRRSQELADKNRELREANARLGELDAVKTAFFSNVSHEFRTPLTLMLGPLEDALADARAPLPDAQRARIALAHGNALRLLKLVNALLDFSRLEAGRMRASFAPLELARFTAELAGMFDTALASAGLRFMVACAPLSEPVWVDRDLMERVVVNLLSNAFKFTLAGSITVTVSESDDAVTLAIADTGIGIAEAELPRIFERFHRVSGATGRTHEGTGIGLSLVRELVEIHGGRVDVASELGRGTTFRVELPKGTAHLPADAVSSEPAAKGGGRDTAAHIADIARWAGAEPREPIARGPGTQSAPRVQGPRARVLVVDDNADLRAYVSELLTSEYDVVTAVDGRDALARVAERTPDVVVSDVMMPRLDGLGLLRALRADEATASIPVLLLSARAGEEDAIEGLDAGSDDYLAKPFSARELIARVRTHVAMAHMRRAYIARLEAMNRELDAFAYSVSHDLRAPLRAVAGFSRALVEDCEAALGEVGASHVARIRAAVERMETLIAALLELSRLARVELERVPVDLTRLAREVVAELRSSEPERRVEVVIADGLRADGDPKLLRVALANLLGNAWKFTAKTPTARIEVGAHPSGDGGDVTFFVADNGAGFDMAHAGRLFGAFQRLHSAGDFPGTGIGLATVRRVVRRHGGEVSCEAAVGRGATFSFTLA